MKALKKINAEIIRLETQQMQICKRLDELYKTRTQLENTEIIQAIRDASFDATDVIAIIQAINKGGHSISDLLLLATKTNHITEESKHEETDTL